MKSYRSLLAAASLFAMATFAADDAGAAAAPKSIVDPKYRGKKANDWVTDLIVTEATKMKTVKKTVAVEGSDEKVTTEEQKPDGVDVDALFALAKANNLDVAKFVEQKDHHGFAGRFRMTVGNMLRGAARNRHGLFNKAGTWTAAPADWLTAQGVEGEPTHNPDGSKIVKTKPAPAEQEPAKEDA